MRLFALFLVSALLFSQTPSRLQAGYDSIQPATLKADLTFLSSDALEGRRSLERGSEVAIQWIASEFAKAGLKPAAGDSYLQPVPLIEYQMDRAQTSLTLRLGDQTETFHAPDATGTFSNETTVSGAVVFAGFGITAPELGYDDYAGIDAKGKIVLIFNHEPQESDANSIFNGRGNTRYANNYSKILNAQRHGAVAVLTMADPSHAGGGRGGAGRGGRGAQQQLRPRIPPEALAEGGTAIPAFALSAAVAGKLFAAAGKTPAAVLSAIDSKPAPTSFEIPGARVELHTVVADRKRANSYNVAGLLEGSDPALRAETVVFSAHFDHDGVGPLGIMHGADDNGSGTVGVVALAHAFARNPEKPKRSILFVVFAAEERGLLGAYYYVSHPLRPLATTRAEINFDMIGRNEAPVNPAVPPAGDIRGHVQRIGPDRHPLQPGLPGNRGAQQQNRGPEPHLQMGPRFHPAGALSQRPVSLPDARYSGSLVVHGVSSRLSPGDRHGREDQLSEDGEDSAPGVFIGLRIRRRSGTRRTFRGARAAWSRRHAGFHHRCAVDRPL